MLTKVPPDGGWGWIVVVASALNGLATIPILQGFGLVFKDFFAVLNLTATDTAIIINVNLAFGSILGLVNGPLLKIYGYRKVAMVGGIIFAIGIMTTAFANSFTLFIICYGVLSSIGMGMALSSFSLATNSYFTKKRRGRAVGMVMTLTGLGPIFMPQITSFLLTVYGIQGTVLILGAFSLHGLVGALLLQPLKWHMKSAPICLETVTENPKILADLNDKQDTSNFEEDETNVYSSALTVYNYQRKRRPTISSIDHDVEVGSIYGFDTPLPRQTSIDATTSYNDQNYEMKIMNGTSKTNLYDSHKGSRYQNSWLNSSKSVDSIHLGSSMKLFEEPVPKKLTFVANDVSKSNGISQNIMEKDSLLERETNNSIKENNNNRDENNSAVHRILRRIADLYDFNLLRDPIYVNIMLGMSIAIFAEINFSMLMPFILADMGLKTAEIANVLSIVAIVDLILRSVAPFLGEWLRLSPRLMYMLSLCLLILSRASLIFVNGLVTMIAVAIGLGAAKGIRSVYMVLVIPSYVPIQKLPNASGIQMLTNGMILLTAGPMIGLIRDNTGNYTICIILLNCVTALTIFIWTIEMLIRRYARQKSQLSGLDSK